MCGVVYLEGCLFGGLVVWMVGCLEGWLSVGLVLCGVVCLEGRLLTRILWEADSEGRVVDLVLEQVLFVEEQDDGGVHEPLVVTDGVEQFHTLHHSGQGLVR